MSDEKVPLKKDTAINLLKELVERDRINTNNGKTTNFNSSEIQFLNALKPFRYDDESFELYKLRQKLQKKIKGYVRIIPNRADADGKAIPRIKDKK